MGTAASWSPQSENISAFSKNILVVTNLSLRAIRDNNVFIVHRRYFMKIRTICECLQLPEKNLNFWHRQKKTPAVYIVKVMPGLMGLI